jgi:hypothetical protein
MATKVMVGARAKVFVDNQLVGIFESCTYNTSIGVEAIHLLGRYSPDEITPTSYEAVTLQCSGFRVVGSGVHTLPKFPKLQDILGLEAVTIAVVDRQSGDAILTAIGCIGTTNSGGFNARATSKVQINYTGLRLSDESGAQDEGGAVSLP